MAAHILNDHIVVNCTSSDIDPKNECIHFLTHIGRHQKSLSGIISSHIKKVYTSEFNVWYLRTFFDANNSQFVGVPLWTKRQVKTKGKSFTFEFFNANHCPGAVMILMKGDFGSYLYTGNCRYNPAMLDYTSLKPYSQDIKLLDKLYVNAAYLKMEHNFPKRELVIQQVLDFISDHSEEKIYMCTRLLGKEDILFRIALELNEKIYVTPDKLKILNKLGYKTSLFTTEMCLARLRVVDVSEITGVKMKRRRLTEKCVGIIFSACNTNEEKLKKQGIYIFPASDHSSANETKLMMKAFKATDVYLLNSDSTLSIYIQHQKNINTNLPNPPIINSLIGDSYKNEINPFSNKRKLSLKLNSPRGENQPLSSHKLEFKISSKSTSDRKVHKQRQISLKNNSNNKSVSKASTQKTSNLSEKQSTEMPSKDHSDAIIKCSDNAKVVEISFLCDDNARSGYCSSGDQNCRRDQLSPSFPPSVSNIILTDLSCSSGSIEHYSPRCSLSSSESAADKISNRDERNGHQKKATNYKNSYSEQPRVSENKSVSPEYPPSVPSIDLIHSSAHSGNVKASNENPSLPNNNVSLEHLSSINSTHSSTNSGIVTNSKENNDISPEYPPSVSSIDLIHTSAHSGNVKASNENPNVPNNNVSLEHLSSINSTQSSTNSGIVTKSKENNDISPEYPPSVSSIDLIHSSAHSENVKASNGNPSVPNNNVTPEHLSSINSTHSSTNSGFVKTSKENNEISPEYPPSVSSIDSIHSSTHSRNVNASTGDSSVYNNNLSPEYLSSISSINSIHSSTHSGNVKASNIPSSVADNNNVSSDYPSSIPSVNLIHSPSHVTSNNDPCEHPCVTDNNDISSEYSSSINYIQSSTNGIKVKNKNGAAESKNLSQEYSPDVFNIDTNNSSTHRESNTVSSGSVSTDPFLNQTSAKVQVHETLESSQNDKIHSPSNSCSHVSCSPVNLLSPSFPPSVSNIRLSEKTPFLSRHLTEDVSCISATEIFPGLCQINGKISSISLAKKVPKMSFRPSYHNQSKSIGRISSIMKHQVSQSIVSSSEREEDASIIQGTITDSQDSDVFGKRKSNFTLRLKVISESPASSQEEEEEAHSPIQFVKETTENESMHCGLVSMNLTKVVNQGSDSHVVLMDSTCNNETDIHEIMKSSTKERVTKFFPNKVGISSSDSGLNFNNQITDSLNESDLQVRAKCQVENSSIFVCDVHHNKVTSDESIFKIDKIQQSHLANKTHLVKNKHMCKSAMSLITLDDNDLTISPLRTVEESRINHLFSADIHKSNKKNSGDCVELTLCNNVLNSKNISDVENKTQEALMDKSETTVLYTKHEVVCEVYPRPRAVKKPSPTISPDIYEQTTLLLPQNCLSQVFDDIKSRNYSDNSVNTEQGNVEMSSQKEMFGTQCNGDKEQVINFQEISRKEMFPLNQSDSSRDNEQNVNDQASNQKQMFQSDCNRDKEQLANPQSSNKKQICPSDCSRDNEQCVNVQPRNQKEMSQPHQSLHCSNQIEIITKSNSEFSESEKVTTDIQASINSSESFDSLVNKKSLRSQRNKRRRKKQSASTQCPISQSSTATQKFTSLPLLRSSLSSFSNSSGNSKSKSASFENSQLAKPIPSKHFKSLHSESTLPQNETHQDDQTENTPPNLDESKSTQLNVDVQKNSSNQMLQNKKSNMDMFLSFGSANVSTQSSLTKSAVNTQDQTVISQCSDTKALSHIVITQDQTTFLKSSNNKNSATILRSQLKPPATSNIKKLNLSQPLRRKPFATSLPLSQPPLTGSVSTNLRSRLPIRYPNIKPT